MVSVYESRDPADPTLAEVPDVLRYRGEVIEHMKPLFEQAITSGMPGNGFPAGGESVRVFRMTGRTSTP